MAVLSVLVFVHELGHFVVARKFGLKPKEFGFGFPPRALGLYKDKENKWRIVRGNKEVTDASDTVYSINWLPLGGFVNLEEDEDGGDDPNHFSNKKPWQRTTILLAGVSMNIVLAATLLSIGFMIGLPQNTADIAAGAKVTDRKIQIVEVAPDSPAKNADIKIGDIILSIDGNKFFKLEDVQDYVDKHTNEKLNYEILRSGQKINLQITPVKRPETGRGGIGVSISETGMVSYSFFAAIWEGVKTTFFLIWAILVAFYNLFKGLLMGAGVSGQVAGPVGIAVLTGQVARMGFVYILQFAAVLSINLAIINALPFPALDGGRVIFIIIEKLKGRPVSKKLEMIFHQIGFSLLMLLIIFITYKDIVKYSSGFFKKFFG